MTAGSYRRKDITETVSDITKRVQSVETTTKLMSPRVYYQISSLYMPLSFQFQSTQFNAMFSRGRINQYAVGASSGIDEETNAAVAAYATFDDVGGNGTATTSGFDSSCLKVPLLDGESRTAYYHGTAPYIGWDTDEPWLAHPKVNIAGSSVRLNDPGTIADDQKAFVYYDSHANFNISVSVSVAMSFYPTDVASYGGETFRFLFYRYIDASNYYMICLKCSDKKIYVFVNEGGTTTKKVSNSAVNVNAWNLIAFTYDPSPNTLTIYLNNVSTSSTPADSVPTLYTTNTNMYIGGLPNLPNKRFSGYLNNFIFWTSKILTSGEATNLWNRGTISS